MSFDDPPVEQTDFADAFTVIAPYYDELMASIPYEMWVDYVCELMRKWDYEFETVLDVACGTGNVAFEFARRGYEVAGVDKSAAMIEVARQKAAKEPDLKVEFFCQDACDLKLDRKFDLAVCLFDSLNYILSPHDLVKAFAGVASSLQEGGYFVFDMNSEYALRENLFTQDNLHNPNARLHYFWVSRYDENARLCRVEMFFEFKESDGQVKRFKELHYQRAYSIDEVMWALAQGGLELVKAYEAYSFRAPRSTSERIYFVTWLPTQLTGS